MRLVLKVEQLVLKQQFKKGLKMSQIHFDDFGARRLFTQNVKQTTGIIAGSNLSNVPVSDTKPKLPLTISDLFMSKIYTGSTTDQVLNSNNLNFKLNKGLLWFKALDTISDNALFNLTFSSTSALKLSTNSGAVISDDILNITESNIVLKGNGQFANIPNKSHFVMCFLNNKDFFYSATTNHNFGVDTTINLNEKIKQPSLIVVKTQSASGGFITWHGALGNGKYLSLNSVGQETVGSLLSYNALNHTVTLDKSLISDIYHVFVFGHQEEPTGNIFGGTFNGTNLKVNLPWEPGTLLLKQTNANSSLIVLNHNLGVIPNADDKYITQASAVASLGNIGHFLPDGFQYTGPTGNFIFVAIRKN